MRVAVVLPTHRLWEWHRYLIDRLADHHSVTVFLDDRAPPYPLGWRVWLQTELAVCNRSALSWPDGCTAGNPWRAELAPEFDRIVDLSEQERPCTPSVAIRYDGRADSAA